VTTYYYLEGCSVFNSWTFRGSFTFVGVNFRCIGFTRLVLYLQDLFQVLSIYVLLSVVVVTSVPTHPAVTCT